MRPLHVPILFGLTLTPLSAFAQSFGEGGRLSAAPVSRNIIPSGVQPGLTPRVAPALAENPTLALDIGQTPEDILLIDAEEPAPEMKGSFETEINSVLPGIVEYRWNGGDSPSLAIAGLPAQAKFRRGTLMLGLNYEFD